MRWLLWLNVIERHIVWGVAEARRIERLAAENAITRREAKDVDGWPDHDRSSGET